MLFGSRAFLNQAVLNSLLDMLEEKGVIDREDHIQIYRNAGWKEKELSRLKEILEKKGD